MEQAKLVGVGFMGRPDRVARLLNKVVENANQVYDIPIQGNPDNVLTGFYLGFTKQTLNLGYGTLLTSVTKCGDRFYRNSD